MDKIYSLTGVKPFIYVQHSAAATYNNIQAAGYPLWGAQYANYNQTNYQSSPWRDGKVWGSWGNDPTIRQYSSSGRITGYGSNLDLDLFYGTKEDWKNFAKPANKTTTTTTPTQTSGGTKVTVATTDFTKYANQVSNSGGDERWGIRGGAAGDQTGHEWELKNWYSFHGTVSFVIQDNKFVTLLLNLVLKLLKIIILVMTSIREIHIGNSLQELVIVLLK